MQLLANRVTPLHTGRSDVQSLTASNGVITAFNEALYPEEAAALRAIDAPADSLVVGLDLAAPADGLSRMIAAKRAGRTIGLLPILRDPLEELMGRVWSSIADTADPEQRLTHIVALKQDQLAVNGGLRPSQAVTIPESEKHAAILALRLADVLLLGAPKELQRWSHFLDRPFRRSIVVPIATPNRIAKIEDGITVYAPATPRALLRNIDVLIAERKLRALFITAENPDDEVRTRVVVAPEWWRALRARSLAAAGHKVVAPDQSGLEHLSPNIFSFAASDLRSLESAIDAALAASPLPEPTSEIDGVARRLADDGPPLRSGPLVSIIVRTYDRAELLERALKSIVAQTYENVEIVVVNNGGPDVSELVQSSVGTRPYQYLTMPKRLHIGAASNVGARAARGEYIGYLDDDDLLYADHCSRTSDVLGRTAADIVYTICSAEYARISQGRKDVFGFQIFLDREFNRDALYVTNVAPIHSIVHRRDLFDRFGYFDETLPVTDDWELWLRACSRGATFVHLDRVTCEYSWRHDPERGNMTIDSQQHFVDAYREIVNRYANDVRGRANIHAAQQQTLAAQISRATQMAAEPAQAASIMLASMLATAVPVAPVPE